MQYCTSSFLSPNDSGPLPASSGRPANLKSVAVLSQSVKLKHDASFIEQGSQRAGGRGVCVRDLN